VPGVRLGRTVGYRLFRVGHQPHRSREPEVLCASLRLGPWALRTRASVLSPIVRAEEPTCKEKVSIQASPRMRGGAWADSPVTQHKLSGAQHHRFHIRRFPPGTQHFAHRRGACRVWWSSDHQTGGGQVPTIIRRLLLVGPPLRRGTVPTTERSDGRRVAKRSGVPRRPLHHQHCKSRGLAFAL